MKRILFVDDETNVHDGIRRMLYANRNSWDIKFAASAEAALQACEVYSFDAVITDMLMPGMDGATFLGLVRDRFPSTARVLLSGYIEGYLETRALAVAHRFLFKPCAESELRTTIERLFLLQDLLSSPAIRKIVGTAGELPSLSATYSHLAQVAMDPSTSIREVTDIVQEDAAMSAKVLELTNSAFFGLSKGVTNISGAVDYLGMETVKNLALTFEAFRIFEEDSCIPASVHDSIQHHSFETAAIAGALPVKRGIRKVTVVAALLHDIGSLFLASRMPDQFNSVHLLAKETGRQPYQVEEELLGVSHAEIGAFLLRSWGIPNLAVEAIAHHHHPNRVRHSEFDCSVAVYVADLLARELEGYPEGSKELEIAECDRVCLDALGVLPSLDEFRELAMQCQS
jgi:putative nucleotidyltransferase with HDIG domain